MTSQSVIILDKPVVSKHYFTRLIQIGHIKSNLLILTVGNRISRFTKWSRTELQLPSDRYSRILTLSGIMHKSCMATNCGSMNKCELESIRVKDFVSGLGIEGVLSRM